MEGGKLRSNRLLRLNYWLGGSRSFIVLLLFMIFKIGSLMHGRRADEDGSVSGAGDEGEEFGGGGKKCRRNRGLGIR